MKFQKLNKHFAFLNECSKTVLIACILINLLKYCKPDEIDRSYHSENLHLKPMSLSGYIEKLKSCLIFVTNNRRRDILFWNVPIVLRLVDFGQMKRFPKLKKHSDKTLADKPDLFYLPNSNRQLLMDIVGNIYDDSGKLSTAHNYKYYYDKVFKCNTSNFLYGGPEFEFKRYGICSKIDFVKYSSHSRSWKCEAFLDIFPSTKYYSNGNLINYWQWEESSERVKPLHFRYRKYVPYTMTEISAPRINILILPFVEKNYLSELIEAWVDTIIYKNKRFMGKLDMFLIIRAKPTSRSNIKYYQFSKLYALIPWTNLMEYVKVDLNLVSEENLQNVPSQFTTRVFDQQFDLQKSYIDRKFQCKFSQLSQETRTDLLVKSFDMEMIRNYAIDFMIQTILPNASNTNPCAENSNKLEFWVDAGFRMIHNSTLPSIIYASNYRFVSCGRSEDNALPFSQLVSSFEWPVWACIIVIFYFVVPITITCLLGKPNNWDTRIYEEMLISSYKLLLEQGNPFSRTRCNVHNLKWIIAAAFLATHVISSAYKRDNILKMVQPRGKVPYELFSQLVNHSFEIYTKASRITLTSKCLKNPKKCFTSSLTKINPHVYANSYLKIHSDVIQFKDTNAPFFDTFFRNSKIVPETMSEKVHRSQTDFLLRQDDLILKQLKRCSRQAAVLPETLAVEMEMNLKQRYRKDEVYVGKNVLFQRGLFFAFSSTRSVNFNPTLARNMLNRFIGYKTGGFLERWNKLVVWMAQIRQANRNKAESNTGNNISVGKASMNSNISVIFIVLAAGLLLSVKVFLAEHFASRLLIFNRWNLLKIICNYIKAKLYYNAIKSEIMTVDLRPTRVSQVSKQPVVKSCNITILFKNEEAVSVQYF